MKQSKTLEIMGTLLGEPIRGQINQNEQQDIQKDLLLVNGSLIPLQAGWRLLGPTSLFPAVPGGISLEDCRAVEDSAASSLPLPQPLPFSFLLQ